jgi:Effector-associated domain 11
MGGHSLKMNDLGANTKKNDAKSYLYHLEIQPVYPMLTKSDLKRLVAEGKTKEVIDSLTSIAKQLGDSSLQNDVVQQGSRLVALQREENSGTISFENAKMTRARIERALLVLIDKLKEPLPSIQQGSDPVQIIIPVSSSSNSELQVGPSKRSLWFGAVCLFAVVSVFIVMVSLQGKMGNAEPLGEMLFIVLLGILAGVAYFQLIGGSAAESDGKWLGMNLKFRGPIVVGVLVAVGSFVFAGERRLQTTNYQRHRFCTW